MEIIVSDNHQNMSKAAAELVAEQIKKQPKTVLVLPTGQTQLEFYGLLAKAVRDRQLSFRQVKIFLLDEYVGLARTAPQNFANFMEKRLFRYLDIKTENIFFLNGQAQDLTKEAERYETLIRRQGGFDILVLGLGLNGHIAFNEPGSDFTSRTRVVKLTERTRLANVARFRSLEAVPPEGITMGLETIMKAKKIILMASGDKKADIVKRAFAGRVSQTVPASILQRHRNFTLILDRAAAKKLMANKLA